MEEEAFWAIVDYMQEAGMVELGSGGKTSEEPKAEELTASTPRASSKKKEEPPEEVEGELRIQPEGDISPEEEPVEKDTGVTREETPEETESEPATDLSIELEESNKKGSPEETDEFGKKEGEREDALRGEGESLEPEESSREEETTPREEEGSLNTAERMIKERFGEVGLNVYTLIDGTKTTQEIMDETGVSDTKLVEILNFLEDRGIIKMEERERASSASAPQPSKEEMLGDVLAPDEGVVGSDPKGFPTIDTPVKLGVDIVKSLKIKADLILKFGDKGTKIFEAINGKSDVLDIATALQIPLYDLFDVIGFLLNKNVLIMKPLKRLDVKKKYGDAGFSVYKKYGREGVFLYELIDKNLSIKQMAQRVTKDKEKFLDLFLFIRKVLNIEIPIDRDVLMKQLG
jgi:hypothetical protein